MFQKPHVTVTMKRQRKNAIMVIGAVKEPGLKELPRGSCSLLAALVSAGGLSEDAGTDVEIRPSLRQQRRARSARLQRAPRGRRRRNGVYRPTRRPLPSATQAAESSASI